METDNGLDLMVPLQFTMSPQIGGIVPKPYYLVTYLTIQQVKITPDFHVHSIKACSATILMNYNNFHTIKLTGTYTCELYEIPSLQWYMANSEIKYKIFTKRHKSHQLTTMSLFNIEYF